MIGYAGWRRGIFGSKREIGLFCKWSRNYLGNQIRPRLLEIGCGTGFVLQQLAAEDRYQLIGLESHIAGLRHARARLPSVDFVQADARDLPYDSEFDAIGAFDVIEHVSRR